MCDGAEWNTEEICEEHEDYLGRTYISSADSWMWQIVKTTPAHAIVEPKEGASPVRPQTSLRWPDMFEILFPLKPMCLAMALEDVKPKWSEGGMHATQTQNYPETLSGGMLLRKGDVVLFMGEIEEMPGHCVVARQNGSVLWGYHTDNFRALREHEI